MSRLKSLYCDIKHKNHNAKMKRKYPDWEDNEYNIDALKFIWGVKSWDDPTNAMASLRTMNDIEIDYDRTCEKYILSLETIYYFNNGKNGEVKYLNSLLSAFTKFMIQNDYDLNAPYDFLRTQSTDMWEAESIPELYTKFKIFVEGYKAIYGGEESA